MYVRMIFCIYIYHSLHTGYFSGEVKLFRIQSKYYIITKIKIIVSYKLLYT